MPLFFLLSQVEIDINESVSKLDVPIPNLDALLKEIRSHFELEIQGLKKLFQLELIHDQNFANIRDISNQLTLREDPQLRDNLTKIISNQRDILLQLQTTKKDMEYLNRKREELFAV